jgi:hypothetical protein
MNYSQSNFCILSEAEKNRVTIHGKYVLNPQDLMILKLSIIKCVSSTFTKLFTLEEKCVIYLMAMAQEASEYSSTAEQYHKRVVNDVNYEDQWVIY